MDTYVVLVDVSTDWPECVHVGSWEACSRVAREIPDTVQTSVQAVVSYAVALDELSEAETDA